MFGLDREFIIKGKKNGNIHRINYTFSPIEYDSFLTLALDKRFFYFDL